MPIPIPRIELAPLATALELTPLASALAVPSVLDPLGLIPAVVPVELSPLASCLVTLPAVTGAPDVVPFELAEFPDALELPELGEAA